MAELTTQERLQPSLLDRLIDDEPQSRTESRERRVMSMRQLRLAVLRDLEWLLNASCRPLGDELHAYPLAGASVLNYGIPDMTGLASSGISQSRVEQMVHQAILNYEPRVVGGSLGVRAVASDDVVSNHIVFEIAGELCPLPMPEALFVRTDLDLETGQCLVREKQR
ncbi:MAG: type VI secretion system baseplate subunit TssE [Phycisphaerales bacterium]|nr:type VI secretion system baseplate subunit TssE [Phycisphaerales bacterium]